MLHVSLKHLLLFYLIKLIRTNKLLTLSKKLFLFKIGFGLFLVLFLIGGVIFFKNTQ